MSIRWKLLFSKIPTKVKFGKSIYEIMWTDDSPDFTSVGETRFDTKQIILRKGYGAKETVHTYVHECIHALEYEYKVGLTENQVLALEKSLKDILKKGNIFND